MWDLGAPLCTENGMLRYKEGYILLLNWSIAFLVCIINVGGTSDSICKPLMCQILQFLSMLTLKLHTKYCHIWGTLSAQEMGCYAARKGIHCWLSVSWLSLDICGSLEELLTSFTSPLWSTWCHFYPKQLSYFIKYVWFGALSSLHEKWDDLLKGENYIAAQVFHNLP